MTKIVIDGNIGSGKTTQLDLLEQQGKYNIKKEPIEKWPLDLYYSDPKRWGFLFQIIILQTLKADEDLDVIYERSPLSSRYVFWELMEKTILEDETYKKQYDLQGWEPDVYILINKSPEKCFEHIQKRNQEGDTKISLTYLQLLHDKYIEMFDTQVKCKKRYIIDGNKSIEEINSIILNLLQ